MSGISAEIFKELEAQVKSMAMSLSKVHPIWNSSVNLIIAPTH